MSYDDEKAKLFFRTVAGALANVQKTGGGPSAELDAAVVAAAIVAASGAEDPTLLVDRAWTILNSVGQVVKSPGVVL